MRAVDAATLAATPQPAEPMTTIGLARLIEALNAPCECERDDLPVECQEDALDRFWLLWARDFA